MIFISMQVVVLILGCFIEQVSIMMITLPMFMHLVTTFGFDPVWFGIIMLINLEVAMLSPPFGMLLFVMKGVAPPDITMGDIYQSAIPFVLLDLAAMAILTIFPPIATWLPYLIKA
jgi:TRAP-type mannitol/chloroaromatic compound transport system permease large subunit